MAKSRRSYIQKLQRLRRLGEILLEEDYITEEQLSTAIEEQSQTSGLLGEILVGHGALTEWDIAKCLVSQLGLPFIFSSNYDVPNEAVDVLPHAFLHQHRLLPLDIFGKSLILATAGNITQEVLEEIELSTSLEVMLYIALASDIQSTLQDKFPLENVTNELSAKFDQLFQEEQSTPDA